MAQPHLYQTEAIVIKKQRLGEAGRILTFYTPHLGRVQGVAKGVSKSKSKLSGHLEMFTHSQVSFARGKSIDAITGSQTINSFLAVKDDLSKISYAYYFTELVWHFGAENASHPSLFQLLLDTLNTLGQENSHELLRHYFEMQIISETGYRPRLECCSFCRSKLKEEDNYFSPEGGGILCPKCNHKHADRFPISVNCIKVLRVLQQEDFQTAKRLKLNNAIFNEIDALLRHQLRYLLERDIKSLSWLDIIRNRQD